MYRKKHLALVVLLVALLLTGCVQGTKTYTVTVEIDTGMAGVVIYEGSVGGKVLGTTNAQGKVELKNLKGEVKLVGHVQEW